MLVLNELLRCSNAEWERRYSKLIESTETKQNVEVRLSNFVKPRFTVFSKRNAQYPIIANDFHTVITESSLCRQLISEKFDYICLDVLGFRTMKYGHIQQGLLNILPRLAAYNKERFVNEFLPITMNFLLLTLKGREKERAHAFITTGLIAVAVGDKIKPYVSKIMEVVKLALPNRETPSKKRIIIDSSVFKCINFLGHAVKSHITQEIQDILESMLATGLSPSLTICLRELAANIPELKQAISIGLLRMLSQILMNKPLRHPGMPRYSNVLSLSGGSENHETSIIVLALHTLGTFDFEGQSLLQFVQRCAGDFLNHEQQEIRLEAVRTCSRLLKQAIYSIHNSVIQPSETVTTTVADVLSKLLIVGMTDTDPDVRFWVLYSLDSTFDNHLAQAESLSALFVALHDEVFEIREVALCTIGRLSTMNPAYIMPSLRKTLVQLLTELEHSGTGRNKEQGARMLDHLVVSAPRLIRPYMEPILKVCIWRCTIFIF